MSTLETISRALISAAWCGLVLAGPPLPADNGDPVRGQALTVSSGCLNCHRIEQTGSRLGPNLSDIGRRRSTGQLQRSLIAPDEEVLPENRWVNVVMKDGTAVKGRLLNHDTTSVQMLDTKEQLRSFGTSEIRGYEILTKGLMPSFDAKLSSQEIADIVAYLSSMKGAE
jgi:putative heme-binding domain-containing protein